MKKKEKAIKYFRNKFNCSQAVFAVFGTEEGLSEDNCLKLGCGFGGGIGRQQLTCGALSGAVLALGMKYGKALNDSDEKKTETYARTKELFEKFERLHGTTVCRELLKGYNMNDPDDHKRITDLRLFEILCEKYVASAVEITESIMKR